MGEDANFRLKAFAVIACVLGVFLVSYVAQRVYFWLRTRKREDVETSRVAPFIDFGLLALGGLVIWLSIEALILAIATSGLNVQPPELRKIAEIEVGKLDRENDQTNLLFYRVDQAGRRLTEQRRPVLTFGDRLDLQVEIVQWRGVWGWLGGEGFYQFVSLGGLKAASGTPTAGQTRLDPVEMPRGMGTLIFLREPQTRWVGEVCREGEIWDILLDPQSQSLSIRVHE